MKNIFEKLSLNQKLAALALFLGAAALLAGDPYRGPEVTVNTKELSLIVNNEVDHISVDELADWIIKGKSDFRLIDLRTEKEFSEYHIPQAENVAVAALPDFGLTRNEKIILYSEGGIHSAQAWFLLKAQKYNGAYILFGGLEEWKDRILFPKLSTTPTAEEQKLFEKKKEIALYFGGVPQTGTTEVAQQTIAMPKLSAPAAAAVKPAGGKKKKEGC